MTRLKGMVHPPMDIYMCSISTIKIFDCTIQFQHDNSFLSIETLLNSLDLEKSKMYSKLQKINNKSLVSSGEPNDPIFDSVPPSEVYSYSEEEESSPDISKVLSTHTKLPNAKSTFRVHIKASKNGVTVVKMNSKAILQVFNSETIDQNKCLFALRALEEFTKFNLLRGMKIYNVIAKVYHTNKIKAQIIKSLSKIAISEPSVACEAIFQLLRYGGDVYLSVRVKSFSTIAHILQTIGANSHGFESVLELLNNVHNVTSCILDAFPMILEHSACSFAQEDWWKSVVYHLLVKEKLEIAHVIINANPELLSTAFLPPLYRLFLNRHIPATCVMLAMLAREAMILSSDCLAIYEVCKARTHVDRMALMADYELARALSKSSTRVNRQIKDDLEGLHTKIFAEKTGSSTINSLCMRDLEIYIFCYSLLRCDGESIVEVISRLSQLDHKVSKYVLNKWSFLLDDSESRKKLKSLDITEKSDIVLLCRLTGQNLWDVLVEQTVVYHLEESERIGSYALFQCASNAVQLGVSAPVLLIPVLVRLCFSTNQSISMGAIYLLNYIVTTHSGDFCHYFISGFLSVEYKDPAKKNLLNEGGGKLMLFPEVWNLLKSSTPLNIDRILGMIVTHSQFDSYSRAFILDCASNPRVNSSEFDELRSPASHST